MRVVAPLDDSTAPRPCLVEGRQTTLCVCEVTLSKYCPGKIVYLSDLNRKRAARPSYVSTFITPVQIQSLSPSRDADIIPEN